MRRAILVCMVSVVLAFSATQADAGVVEPAYLEFETALEQMNLTGGPFPMPLASDPDNSLGDSIEGFGFVESQVAVTLSSQRSVNPGPASIGTAIAYPGVPQKEKAVGKEPPPVDPNQWHGETFWVDSFFDVFFDITVTDVDSRPGRDYAGMPDGDSVLLQDNGPANMRSSYTAMFDKEAPNFGLIPPPEVAPYIGHFMIEIPLGGDINGNGEDDKIKFTLVEHQVNDENRSYIELPDGTILDTFDSEAFLEGAVVDESTDPPFTIGGTAGPFGGPTTASSDLQNDVIPEPTSLVIWALLAVLGVALGHRRRKRRVA